MKFGGVQPFIEVWDTMQNFRPVGGNSIFGLLIFELKKSET
jgi:hypothetical protein